MPSFHNRETASLLRLRCSGEWLAARAGGTVGVERRRADRPSSSRGVVGAAW